MFASELTTMIAAGAGLVVGTVDADRVPRGIRAWAAWVVDPDARRVRVVLTADDPIVNANLPGGYVALTAADVRTFRSVQLKGRVVRIAPPTPEDVELARNRTDLFFEAVVETDGNPLELLFLMLPSEMVTIEIEVDEEFDQTPGPSAGAAMRSAGR